MCRKRFKLQLGRLSDRSAVQEFKQKGKVIVPYFIGERTYTKKYRILIEADSKGEAEAILDGIATPEMQLFEEVYHTENCSKIDLYEEDE